MKWKVQTMMMYSYKYIFSKPFNFGNLPHFLIIPYLTWIFNHSSAWGNVDRMVAYIGFNEKERSIYTNNIS